MIIVTGTKRSGTSMWMQILRAAGLEVIGSAFPRDWKEVIEAANPEGFYESRFRQGIYYRTNPDPRSGEFLHPGESSQMAVKVFIPGLIRTDLAFVDRVVATMRSWREYHGSLTRLYDLEHANRHGADALPRPKVLTPTWEWWRENFSLLSDFLTRRYPIHMVAYESVLERPGEVITEALEWLGRGDSRAAIASVKPDLRTHAAGRGPEVPDVEPELAELFDELYERVRDRRGLDGPFIARLNRTNESLAPRIQAEVREVRRDRWARRREARERSKQNRPQHSHTLGAGERTAERDRASQRQSQRTLTRS